MHVPALTTQRRSMRAMAREVAPWLPTGLLLSCRFDNVSKIGTYSGPVFLSHGRDDTVVPYAMSEALRQAIPGPVTFVPLDGAGHNDLFESVRNGLFDPLRQFLGTL